MNPDERTAALLDEAGAPLLWCLVAFMIAAIMLMAGAL